LVSFARKFTYQKKEEEKQFWKVVQTLFFQKRMEERGTVLYWTLRGGGGKLPHQWFWVRGVFFWGGGGRVGSLTLWVHHD